MEDVKKELGTVRIGILLSVLTLIFGFGLGGVFGAAEDSLKDYFKSEAQSVFATKYGSDQAKVASVVSRSWSYFKRAHFHANGLGTASLALIFLLTFLQLASRLKRILAASLGIGAFGYSFYWMLAGILAPAMGGAGPAKEALTWLAVPTAGLCILGVITVFVLLITRLFTARS